MSAATFGRLVLAGSRAYWEESEGGNTVRDWTIRSTLRPFASRTVAQGSADVVCPAGGTDIGPTVGSGTTFVYSTHDLFPSNPDCGDEASDALVSASRIVARPSGLDAAVVPGVPGAPTAFPWGRLLAYRQLLHEALMNAVRDPEHDVPIRIADGPHSRLAPGTDLLVRRPLARADRQSGSLAWQSSIWPRSSASPASWESASTLARVVLCPFALGPSFRGRRDARRAGFVRVV